jgi:predicted phage terminase large subunit-like protein
MIATETARPKIDNPAEKEQALRLYLARRFLVDFTTTTFPIYQVKWYHKLLCSKLDDLLSRKIKRLMVFLPPQRGKSELVSRRFPAFALGRDPRAQIAACSYSADLAEKFNREVQRIVDSRQYAQIFPQTKLNAKNIVCDNKGAWLRNSTIFEIVGAGGSYRSVGVGGPLTGNKVDVGLIDDPIKDRMEAQSETYRNRIWEWYLDVFCTRLHNDSVQLICMTRWHEDDLAGRLLAKEPEKWDVVSLPELREDLNNIGDPRQIGEPLWPERHSLQSTLDIKDKSERTFTSMYQQRPAPAEGNIIKLNYIRYYNQLPPINKIVQSWDAAFEGKETSDYVACTVWGISWPNSYLIYMKRGKWDFVQTINEIRNMSALFPDTSEKLIERKANGSAILSTLQKEIPGLIPFDPGSDSKEGRADAASYVFEAGNIYFPSPIVYPWVQTVIDDIKMFPNGKNDDIVDTITQFIIRTYLMNKSAAFHTGYGRS